VIAIEPLLPPAGPRAPPVSSDRVVARPRRSASLGSGLLATVATGITRSLDRALAIDLGVLAEAMIFASPARHARSETRALGNDGHGPGGRERHLEARASTL
jgi:hypothetical protein